MKEFKTDRLELAPYLLMNGLNYLRAELDYGKNEKIRVVFVFEDPNGLGKDYEIEFMRSDIKRWRDYFFFFRNEIEKINRDFKNSQKRS